MFLVEVNDCSLNDTLDQWIRDFPKSSQISLHQLLCHSSGIYDFSDREDIMEWYKPGASMQDTIDSIRIKPLSFHPGDGFAYSNSNNVLGEPHPFGGIQKFDGNPSYPTITVIAGWLTRWARRKCCSTQAAFTGSPHLCSVFRRRRSVSLL